jgi:predicted nucleic acid-binding protein
VPATDHLIGAVALTYRCYLLHRDRHFELLAHHAGLSLWDPQ